jgi:hypothetical protein
MTIESLLLCGAEFEALTSGENSVPHPFNRARSVAWQTSSFFRSCSEQGDKTILTVLHGTLNCLVIMSLTIVVDVDMVLGTVAGIVLGKKRFR